MFRQRKNNNLVTCYESKLPLWASCAQCVPHVDGTWLAVFKKRTTQTKKLSPNKLSNGLLWMLPLSHDYKTHQTRTVPSWHKIPKAWLIGLFPSCFSLTVKRQCHNFLNKNTKRGSFAAWARVGLRFSPWTSSLLRSGSQTCVTHRPCLKLDPCPNKPSDQTGPRCSMWNCFA